MEHEFFDQVELEVSKLNYTQASLTHIFDMTHQNVWEVTCNEKNCAVLRHQLKKITVLWLYCIKTKDTVVSPKKARAPLDRSELEAISR